MFDIILIYLSTFLDVKQKEKRNKSMKKGRRKKEPEILYSIMGPKGMGRR